MVETLPQLSETEFDQFSFGDYDSESAGFAFDSEAPNGSLNLELGYTQTDSSFPGRSDASGITGSFDLSRGTESPFGWTLSLSRDIGDGSTSIDRGSIDINTDVLLLDSGLAEVSISNDASLSMTWIRGSNNFTLTLSHSEEEFENIDNDRETTSYAASYIRRIRENVTLNGTLSYQDEQFETGDDDITVGRVELAWEATRRLNVSTALAYRERNSDVGTNQYDEWMATISVNYHLFRL